MIPINPEAIGDPNQTPIVYIGEEAGKALGIPQRDPTLPSPTQHPTGQEVDLDVEAIRAQHVPKPDEGFGRWCDWCEMDWPCERVLLVAALDAARADRDILAAIGRMYLAALDEDPENEHLTLPAAYRVTEVREAVERAEARDGGTDG